MPKYRTITERQRNRDIRRRLSRHKTKSVCSWLRYRSLYGDLSEREHREQTDGIENNNPIKLLKDREHKKLYDRLNDDQKNNDRLRTKYNETEKRYRKRLGYPQLDTKDVSENRLSCKNSSVLYEYQMTNLILDRDNKLDLNKYAVTVLLGEHYELNMTKDCLLQKLRRKLRVLDKYGLNYLFYLEPGLKYDNENGEFRWSVAAHGIVWALSDRWQTGFRQNSYDRQIWISQLYEKTDLYRYSRYIFKNSTYYKYRTSDQDGHTQIQNLRMPRDKKIELLDWWHQYKTHQLCICRL